MRSRAPSARPVEAELRAAAASAPTTDGLDLVSGVTAATSATYGDGPLRIVAFDFGVKTTMVRQLAALGTVTVVPAGTSASEVLSLDPDGVFLSNGPGDPAALPGPRATSSPIWLGRVPIFGICLGHQLLSAALGGTTYKLPFGHHGANHPVQRLATGVVEITSQNHNYAVAAGSVPDVEVTHVNLNDGVIEGIPRPEGLGLLGPVPPRGGTGAARRPLPLRRVPLADGGADRTRRTALNEKDRETQRAAPR